MLDSRSISVRDPGADTHPVERALRAAPWFRAGDVVLAAVSGGADSMAMFDALGTLANARPGLRPGLRVIAAHFDHGLRADSGRDFDVVAAHAERLGIRAVRGVGDVAAEAHRTGESIEAVARRARYEFLLRTAQHESATWIATAHTRSDQAETVLMRILRGAGTRGLVGIAARRDAIVRPLLGVTRRDTLDYCTARGIAWVHDPSNDDLRFARNALRHDTLPALRRVFPSIEDVMVRLADSAAEELAAIRRVTTPRIDAALEREASGSWALQTSALADLDPEATAIMIGDVLERVDRRDDVSRVHYRALASIQVGASVDLPRLRVRREHDALVFTLRTGALESAETTAIIERPLDVPGEVHTPGWSIRCERTTGADARARMMALPGNGGAPSHVAFVATAPGDAFRVRAPRTGDRVRPLGMRGHRKLSDVFIDARIPFRRRAASPVLERNGEIVWIPGVVTGESARVGPDTADAVCFVAERADGFDGQLDGTGDTA
jgi:tRNA(Ile)-lysidine synthase